MKREFWETVTELLEALAAPQVSELDLRITEMKVDLPVELVVVQTEVGFRLLIDAPHYRWAAGLRPEPGRLRLALRQINSDEATWLEQYSH
ncbi:MAG: hypothetical protein KDJ52_02360 [Anaerolineae bacterium]|nr:hypothetical protein [Anaerolineae bacterium]